MSRRHRALPTLAVLLGLTPMGSSQGFGAQPARPVSQPAPTVTAPGWTTLLGGADTDTAAALAPLPGGGAYVAGRTQNGAGGLTDLWIARLDARGRPVWQRALGGPSIEEAAALALTDDGGCLVAGWTYGDTAGGSDGLLARFDASGEVLWQRRYGGGGDDRFLSLSAGGDGFHVGGALWDPVTGTDAWLLKVDGAGDIVWQERFAGEQEDGITSVDTTPDGGVVFCANSNSVFTGLDGAAPSIPFFRPWVVRVDPGGAPLWQRAFNASGGDAFSRIVALDDGGYVAVGEILAMAFFRGDLWTVRLDEQGDILWDTRMGDHFSTFFVDSGVSVVPLDDGGFAALAFTGTAGQGSQSLWLVKLDAGGQPVWDTVFGGSGFDSAAALELDDHGALYVAGQVQLGPVGDTQALVARLTPGGGMGQACDLTSPTGANLWTDGLEVSTPTVPPTATSVAPATWPGRTSLVVGHQVACPPF